MGKNRKPRIVTHWRYADVPLSPAWVRLVADLSASRGRDQKPVDVETNTVEEKKKGGQK